MNERTPEAPFPDACRTGRAFISPCCTAAVREFRVDGVLYLASSVVGHGWSAISWSSPNATSSRKRKTFAAGPHDLEMGAGRQRQPKQTDMAPPRAAVRRRRTDGRGAPPWPPRRARRRVLPPELNPPARRRPAAMPSSPAQGNRRRLDVRPFPFAPRQPRCAGLLRFRRLPC